MNNYFRITAYNKELNVCLIADSTFGNIPKANHDENNILLRACDKGRPTIKNGVIEIRGKTYTVNNYK